MSKPHNDILPVIIDSVARKVEPVEITIQNVIRELSAEYKEEMKFDLPSSSQQAKNLQSYKIELSQEELEHFNSFTIWIQYYPDLQNLVRSLTFSKSVFT